MDGVQEGAVAAEDDYGLGAVEAAVKGWARLPERAVGDGGFGVGDNAEAVPARMGGGPFKHCAGKVLALVDD